MAVQIRLMGPGDEVAAFWAALVAGEPVTVMSDGALVPNRHGDGARMYGMGQLEADGEQQIHRARADRLDRDRPALGQRRRSIGR